MNEVNNISIMFNSNRFIVPNIWSVLRWAVAYILICSLSLQTASPPSSAFVWLFPFPTSKCWPILFYFQRYPETYQDLYAVSETDCCNNIITSYHHIAQPIYINRYKDYTVHSAGGERECVCAHRLVSGWHILWISWCALSGEEQSI